MLVDGTTVREFHSHMPALSDNAKSHRCVYSLSLPTSAPQTSIISYVTGATAHCWTRRRRGTRSINHEPKTLCGSSSAVCYCGAGQCSEERWDTDKSKRLWYVYSYYFCYLHYATAAHASYYIFICKFLVDKVMFILLKNSGCCLCWKKLQFGF